MTVRSRFPEVDSKTICQLSVVASGTRSSPIRQGGSGPSEFWVRVGNATKQPHGEDLIKYQEQHWG
jgi:hypothetical protein